MNVCSRRSGSARKRRRQRRTLQGIYRCQRAIQLPRSTAVSRCFTYHHSLSLPQCQRHQPIFHMGKPRHSQSHQLESSRARVRTQSLYPSPHTAISLSSTMPAGPGFSKRGPELPKAKDRRQDVWDPPKRHAGICTHMCAYTGAFEKLAVRK